jgi:ribonuclease Z
VETWLSASSRTCASRASSAAAGADVLVHEATFAEGERGRASDNGHSTARQAAELARDAQVRLLALNHVSTRHPLGLLRDEARAVFPDTVVPRDFDTVEIPYAERGAPHLIRWSDSMSTGEPSPASA